MPVDTRTTNSESIKGDGTGSDRGTIVNGTYAGTQAYTIAAAGSAGFPAAFEFGICNSGSGVLTLTPTTSTINGNATLKLPAIPSGGNPACALVYSDGSNYYSLTGPITDANGNVFQLGAATATSLLATGIVDGKAPITVTTGTTGSLGGTYKSGYTFNYEATAATGVTYTLPTAAAGLQFCISNGAVQAERIPEH